MWTDLLMCTVLAPVGSRLPGRATPTGTPCTPQQLSGPRAGAQTRPPAAPASFLHKLPGECMSVLVGGRRGGRCLAERPECPTKPGAFAGGAGLGGQGQLARGASPADTWPVLGKDAGEVRARAGRRAGAVGAAGPPRGCTRGLAGATDPSLQTLVPPGSAILIFELQVLHLVLSFQNNKPAALLTDVILWMQMI